MGKPQGFTANDSCYNCGSHNGIQKGTKTGRCHGYYFLAHPYFICTNDKSRSHGTKDPNDPLKTNPDGWWHKSYDCRCTDVHKRESYNSSYTPVKTIRVNNKLDNEKLKEINDIWNSSEDLMNNNAALYLMSRGIRIKPDSLRYNKAVYGKECLVAKITDVDGMIKGIQRTHLNGSRKHTEGNPRRSMGSILGNAVRFGSVSNLLGIAEGIEDALSLHQVLKIPVWAALGSQFMHRIKIPDTVSDVIIFADGDEAGSKSIKDCLTAYGSGYNVNYCQAPVWTGDDGKEKKDFNDLLIKDSSGKSIMDIYVKV